MVMLILLLICSEKQLKAQCTNYADCVFYPSSTKKSEGDVYQYSEFDGTNVQGQGTTGSIKCYGSTCAEPSEDQTIKIQLGGNVPNLNGCNYILSGRSYIEYVTGCTEDKPYLYEKTCLCVECYDNSHCASGTCDLESFTCKETCLTDCSGQEIGTECCDQNGNKGMCNGSSCKVCSGGEVYKYRSYGTEEIRCCSSPKQVVSGYNDLEGKNVSNCCAEGFFIPEQDSKVAFSGYMSYCPEKGKMMLQSATGGMGNSCATNSGIFSGYYDLEKVDTTGWSFDDYKSWASNRSGYSEDCGIDYDCGGYGPCVVMDIPPVGSCSGQSDKMPCTSGSENGVCISGECCTTPNNAKTECCKNGITNGECNAEVTYVTSCSGVADETPCKIENASFSYYPVSFTYSYSGYCHNGSCNEHSSSVESSALMQAAFAKCESMGCSGCYISELYSSDNDGMSFSETGCKTGDFTATVYHDNNSDCDFYIMPPGHCLE